jgi:hypothetical protein
LLLLSVACGLPGVHLVSSIGVAPPAVSPDLRDQRNRLDIRYQLTAPATVTSYIVGPDGQRWPVATSSPRPTAGEYVLQFDGTISGPGQNERRVLPDGDYMVVIEAVGAGRTEQQMIPLSIRDADTQVPDIADLALLPDRVSPNFDAQGDVTHVTYRLSKDALVSAFLDTTADAGPPRRVWMSDEVAVTAGEQSFTWDGLANGQPVQDGNYQLGIRARDRAGNVVERSQPLVIENAGVPDASIVSVFIGPAQIIRGDEVCVDATVRNIGRTQLRTQGPDPGFVYNSLDTYATIENHAFAEHAGFWRVGLSWSGGTDITSATYPYRWGFGHDLQPGDEAPVHGCVRVVNDQDKLVFFAGLVQENVAIHNAGAGLVRVQISS